MEQSSNFQTEVRNALTNQRDSMSDVKVEIARTLAKVENMDKQVNYHEVDIKSLNQSRTWLKGAAYSGGSLGAVGAFHAIKTWLGL